MFFPICNKNIQVAIAAGFHLFPFRTEKLSLLTPMVLHTRGRVGSRHFLMMNPFREQSPEGFFFCIVFAPFHLKILSFFPENLFLLKYLSIILAF
jgi:hypothetical protein